MGSFGGLAGASKLGQKLGLGDKSIADKVQKGDTPKQRRDAEKAEKAAAAAAAASGEVKKDDL